MDPVRSARRRQLFCSLAIFAALLGSTAPSPLYPVYAERFGLSHAMNTTVFAVYAIGTLLALLFCGALAARVRDLRAILLPGLAITATGALVFAFAQDLPMLLAGRALNGFGTGMITGIASAAIYGLAAPGRQRGAAALATLAFTAGAAGGPLLTAAALSLNIAPTVTPFIAIVAVALLAIAGLMSSGALAGGAPRKPEATNPSAEDGGMWSSFLLACLGIFSAWTLGAMLMALGADLAHEVYGLQSAAMAGMVAMLFQASGGMGQAIFGTLQPRLSLGVGLTGIALAQAGLVLAAIWGLGGMMLALMLLCGLSYGATFVGALSMASASSGDDRRAALLSRFYICGYAANAGPPLVMGAFADRIGLQAAFFGFSAILIPLAAIGVVMVLLAKTPHPHQCPEIEQADTGC